jgi:diguanylate cyclase (GGDEF)-like protein
MKARLALLLWVIGAAAGWAAAAPRAPDAVAAIESELADDPSRVLREARAAAAALSRTPADTGTDGRAERLRQLVREALAAVRLERTREAATVLPEAQALARELQARDHACLLQAASVWVEYDTRGWAAMAPSAERALEAARAEGPAWCVPRLLEPLALIHSNDGRRAAALAAGQAAEAAFEAAGETLMLAAVRNHLSWTLSERDDDAEAVRRSIALGEQALAGIDPARHRHLAATILHNLTGARIAARDWAGARRDVAASARLASALGDAIGSAYAQRQLGEIELRDGRPAAALAQLRAARAAFADAGIDGMVVSATALEAEALVALQRPAEALRALAAAEPARARVGVAKMDVPYFRVAMEAHAAVRDPAATAAAARAYADALQRRQREENHRLATELQERHASAQREAENRLLRGQQDVQRLRMLALVALLALAGVVLAVLGVHLLQQRRLRARFKHLAEIDELTGLPNRRAILDVLNDAAARQHRGRAIAMLDIDHFKRVNDRHGHAAGDAALVAFARACSGVLREGDVMGRLGGEEFLLVLKRARAGELQALFERLRAALQASAIDGLPAGERLTFSMGAADLPPGIDAEAALRAADEALYQAKAAGRDRLVTGGTLA